ncbi:MAG: SDR family NAD(P)-dependent oxidoreductase [Alphaproteobacteria bacterium]
MNGSALLIGNSDGIGLALTRELLKREWKVAGISRSDSPVKDTAYKHEVADVRHADYPEALWSVLVDDGPFNLCVYCAGIGELLDPTDMAAEVDTFAVNLLGMVKTAAQVIPHMVQRSRGHFIGISSLADEMLSAEAPAYHGSKAGFSNYLEGLALALKPKGVHVTNVRFGFVDTKMAKGDTKPFMMPVDRAVDHLLFCLEKKPIRHTAPRVAIPLVKFRGWLFKLKV